jgi:hypothetical protein
MVNAVWGDIVETPIYRVSPVGEWGNIVETPIYRVSPVG